MTTPKARPIQKSPVKPPPSAAAASETAPAPSVAVTPVQVVESAPLIASTNGHLSETVHVDQWLRLLIVLTTSLLILLALGVTIRLLASIGHTLQLFSLGGLLAYAFAPLVERVRRRSVGKPRPRWVGVLVVFGGLFGLFALGTALLSAEVVHQVGVLSRDHAKIEADGRQKLTDADLWLSSRNIKINLEEMAVHPPPKVREWFQTVSKDAVTALEHVSKSVVESIIVLLIALYFIIYSEEMRLMFNHSLHARLRPYAEHWQSDVNRILGGFVRGQLVLALILGVAAAVGCALLGIRFWLLIGLFVVAASLIPVFGPYIGAVPAVLAAALSPHGFINPVVKVILVILLFFIINEVGSKILYPRLVGAALGLHEVLVLFVLFAGLEVGGIWGVLFAAPLTALAAATVAQLHRLWKGEPPISLAQVAKREGKAAQAHGTP